MQIFSNNNVVYSEDPREYEDEDDEDGDDEDGDDEDDGDEFYECDVPGCDKKYTTKKILRDHRRMQHGNKRPRYMCPEKKCKKTCTTPYNLLIHVETVHKRKISLKTAKGCYDPLSVTSEGKSIYTIFLVALRHFEGNVFYLRFENNF